MKTITLSLLLLFAAWSRICGQEQFFLLNAEASPSAPQVEKALSSFAGLYEEAAPLSLTLKSNFSQLFSNKLNTEYQPAEFQLALDETVGLSFPVRLRTRGKSRLRICNFPPIMLNFKKTELSIPALVDLERAKLVTPCKKEKWYRNYLFKEYLAYKIFNLLTERSFQVRLLDIQFLDAGNEKKSWNNHGFIIEDVDDLAQRIRGSEVNAHTPNSWQQADRTYLLLVAVFQFMIGNTDWHLAKGHNLKFIAQQDAPSILYAVPYDFDVTGLVDAEYALPRQELELENVRQRRYLGYCAIQEDLNAVFQLFLTKEESIYQLITDFPLLSKLEKKHMIRYIKEFYSIIQNPKKVDQFFHQNCKTWVPIPIPTTD